MKTLIQPQSVFVDVLLPRVETRIQAIAKDAILVLSFSLLTALFAQASFWIGLVPITGQTLAVLLAGLLLGSVRGALSQIVYLLVGLTGIPFWFATGGALGVARLIGPTGGYLIGFVFAAFLVGKLAERGWDKKIKTAILAMLIGNIAIYIFGLLWLANFLPWKGLLIAGLYPFILGDALKILLAGLVLPMGWRFIKRSENKI
ncbi:MAG: biotin transporter BioY [Candidatus Nealsonbacteria bacterium]|nr:MAG: biotin transporter BioY [Candidatus Nealsonbacteria bacterium]